MHVEHIDVHKACMLNVINRNCVALCRSFMLGCYDMYVCASVFIGALYCTLVIGQLSRCVQSI